MSPPTIPTSSSLNSNGTQGSWPGFVITLDRYEGFPAHSIRAALSARAPSPLTRPLPDTSRVQHENRPSSFTLISSMAAPIVSIKEELSAELIEYSVAAA